MIVFFYDDLAMNMKAMSHQHLAFIVNRLAKS